MFYTARVSNTGARCYINQCGCNNIYDGYVCLTCTCMYFVFFFSFQIIKKNLIQKEQPVFAGPVGRRIKKLKIHVRGPARRWTAYPCNRTAAPLDGTHGV